VANTQHSGGTFYTSSNEDLEFLIGAGFLSGNEDPYEIYDFEIRLFNTRDAFIEAKMRTYEVAGEGLPCGSRVRAMREMSPAALAALRTRVIGK
jgi:hypothetical protein